MKKVNTDSRKKPVNKARVSEQTVKIPTYKTAAPEKSPLFIEKRAYQGSSGKVYPFPVTEKISDKKEICEYHALILENDYIYVMILPELGGRIQRAYDKTNGYDFVYYNRVIKPALVGLAGPWISGGIEFNWPQHHRPSTFSPVEYSFSENDDGSATVYVGETDRMYGTKEITAITLYPDKAYIEITGRLYNPTDMPQTFLWWANPAVAVNDDTYSVFPPDVNAVMDHGKRAVSTFPIATGEYYKYDYSAGVDISRYKNIKVPTSYMAAHSDFDFIGNFDEGRDAGLLHIADHHISPGKKQWTWGCGDFGKTWDRNLTDEDGPYIELMTGVFTDNQPDFTWLKPHEEKTFTQYFMPYKSVGRVSNATKDAVIGVDGDTVKVYVTAPYKDLKISVSSCGSLIYEKTLDLSPERAFSEKIRGLKDHKITVFDGDGTVICEYKEYIPEDKPVPEPASAPAKPCDIASAEELFLAGQHIEQYRHATFSPADYYLEGLRRDATDIRLNNAYGLLLFRSGEAEKSIPYFKKAIEKQTWRNPNPYDGECFFNLGLALEFTGKYDEAYDAFYKATWSAETQGIAFYHLACISAIGGKYGEALDFAQKALLRNHHDMKVRALIIYLMKRLGKDTAEFAAQSRDIDRLYMSVLYQSEGRETFRRVAGGKAENYLVASLEFMQFGAYDEAIDILEIGGDLSPLSEYYKGYAHYLKNDIRAAVLCFEKAEALLCDYCFPNKTEEIKILEKAISLLGSAPMADYYLGNLLYDKKQYDAATAHWENAVALRPDIAIAHRNLSIAYFNDQHDVKKALVSIEKACSLEPDNSRFILERDQLYAKAEWPVKSRIAALEKNPQAIEERDALCLSYITLLNADGRGREALSLLEKHIFHVWEGGEGKVAEQYKTALFALAEDAYDKGDLAAAESYARRTITYPENLGEGKLPNVPDNRAYYMIGKCREAMGDKTGAEENYLLATSGDYIPSPVRYYNDQPSDYIYYQGLAYFALGDVDKAKRSFYQLVAFGTRHIFDKVGYDFFAVSLPEFEVYCDDIQKRSDDYCRHLRALGEKGLEFMENHTA